MASVNVTVVVVSYQQRQREVAQTKPVEHHKTPQGVPGIKLQDRKCTDPIACCLFILWLFFMVGICGFAFSNGDLNKVSYKRDGEGFDCPGDYQSKLFTKLMPDTDDIVDATATTAGAAAQAQDQAGAVDVQDVAADALKELTKDIHEAVCVKKCPKKDEKVEYFIAPVATKKFDSAEEKAKFDKWTYDTKDVMGFCFPSADTLKGKANDLKIEAEANKQMSEAMGNFARYTNDAVISYPLILIMVFLSLFFTVAYMYILKWITKPVLYFSLFFVFIMGALITYWCFKKSQTYPEGSEDQKYAQGYAVVAGILTLLYVILICCQWKNIKIGAEIMGVAGEFIATTPKIVGLPFVAYFLMVPFTVWWSFSMIYLYATGDITPHKDGEMFVRLVETNQAYWMFWFMLFGFFWVIAFMIAVMQFVIASTCSLWYFTYQQSDAHLAETGLQRSVKWALRTHSGSLAYGSFLIAVVTMLKFIFEYFAKTQEKLTQNNCAAQTAVKCIRCCIWCLDACVKFISENAYCQIAISGCTFCEGAQKSFWMLARNPGTYMAMNVAGWLMTAIGKAAIMGLSVYVCMALADANVGTGGEVIQQPFVPAFIVFLVAWAVAAFFISLFDFSCLTILQCFLISKELKGKLWTPKALQDLIDASDREEAARNNQVVGAPK